MCVCVCVIEKNMAVYIHIWIDSKYSPEIPEVATKIRKKKSVKIHKNYNFIHSIVKWSVYVRNIKLWCKISAAIAMNILS